MNAVTRNAYLKFNTFYKFPKISIDPFNFRNFGITMYTLKLKP